MNWLNINVSTLDSESFIGSEPLDRATWLCLLRYCVGQENGGIIADCSEWTERKWQQLVRVTKQEVERECALWDWDNGSLVVWGYPADKEREVIAKRDAGREGGSKTTEAKTKAAKDNGQKGGRPKTQAETQAEPKQEPNGKEWKGREGNVPPVPPKGGDDAAANGFADSMPTANAAAMRTIMDRINSLHPSWAARPAWVRSEMEILLANARIFHEMTESDWKLLAAYMAAVIPAVLRESNPKAFWQPDHRRGLLEHISSILSNADSWIRELNRRKLPLPPGIAA